MTSSTTLEDGKSAVDFPAAMRMHVALPTQNLDAAVAFYQVLLGAEPVKLRPGYAKFEVEQPAVNLTLNESAEMPSLHPAQHFGIQVKHRNEVTAYHGRLRSAGISTMDEEGVTCCFAVQDKVWAIDPDGHRWEVFVVLEADSPFHSDPGARGIDDSGEPKSQCCA